jgi:hypothetical protein
MKNYTCITSLLPETYFGLICVQEVGLEEKKVKLHDGDWCIWQEIEGTEIPFWIFNSSIGKGILELLYMLKQI